MICFYHSADLDGHCSGAIVRKAYPGCEMIGINYGDEFPWDEVTDFTGGVIMVDFSLPIDQMIRLRKEAKSFIWIDHHKSAIEDAERMNFIPKGIREVSKAGCELTWEYFFSTELPRTVRLLGRYDVWDHEDPDVLPFQYGARQYSTHPDFSIWDGWFDDFPMHVLAEGRAVLRYVDKDFKGCADSISFETELDGLKCIAINRTGTNARLFDSVWDPRKYDAMLTFGWKRDGWVVSLYSDPGGVDVSKIAKARGGGGHKGASGFRCDVLPFALKGR